MIVDRAHISKLAELKSILNPPSIDGPINIPTRSSPKTGGVFRYFATNSPLNFAAISIVAIWKVNLIRSLCSNVIYI